MKNFKDYFETKLGIPEKYAQFGRFGEECYRDTLLSEGLIQSYPKDVLIEVLDNFQIPNISLEVDESSLDQIITVIGYGLSPVSVEDMLELFTRKVKPLGYFVGRVSKVRDPRSFKFLIEPKYPTELDASSLKYPVYHATHKKFLPKIKTKGLSPRDSQTSFSHPGGRIYLYSTPYIESVFDLADIISMNKNNKELADDLPRYNRAMMSAPMNRNLWAPYNMVALKVSLPPTAKLYYDPTIGDINDTDTAFFTMMNIPPQNIEDVIFPS